MSINLFTEVFTVFMSKTFLPVYSEAGVCLVLLFKQCVCVCLCSCRCRLQCVVVELVGWVPAAPAAAATAAAAAAGGLPGLLERL